MRYFKYTNYDGKVSSIYMTDDNKTEEICIHADGVEVSRHGWHQYTKTYSDNEVEMTREDAFLEML